MATTRSAHEHHGAGLDLCGRHSVTHDGVGAWHGAASAKEVVGQGRPPKLLRRDAKHQPVSVKELALASAKACLAHDHMAGRHGREAVLALCPRARSRRASRIRLADSRPEGVAADRMARGREASRPNTGSRRSRKTSPSVTWSIAKLRWRIERDYQELKQEVGLGHFEGRGWRGFHHHATLCIAAYGFLISERETIPPSGPRSTRLFPQVALPEGYRPRGSAVAARISRGILQSQGGETMGALRSPAPVIGNNEDFRELIRGVAMVPGWLIVRDSRANSPQSL